MGATLHLTTHAGYWVREAAAEMPLQALCGLMRACLEFNWAPELHAHFATLVPLLLCPLAGTSNGGTTSCSGGGGINSSGDINSGGGSERQQIWRPQGSTGSGANTGAGLGSRGVGGSSGGGSADDRGAGGASVVYVPAGDTSGGGMLFGSPRHGAQPGGRRATATTEGSVWEASGVDPLLLEDFGGPQELLLHFCRAGSPVAQRCLLLPLLEQCMPPGECDRGSRACAGPWIGLCRVVRPVRRPCIFIGHADRAV
jgi:hypothetical protein